MRIDLAQKTFFSHQELQSRSVWFLILAVLSFAQHLHFHFYSPEP